MLWSSYILISTIQQNTRACKLLPHTLMANLFSSGAPHIYILSQSTMLLLVVWSANSDRSTFTSKASSKVIFLNDDNYRWGCSTTIGSSFGQGAQGNP